MQPKTSVLVRECLKSLGEAGLTAGVKLEPWGERAVRVGMCERLIRAEDELEARGRGAGIRAVRRRLEGELWP